MPNLRGASPVDRGEGSRLYSTWTVGKIKPDWTSSRNRGVLGTERAAMSASTKTVKYVAAHCRHTIGCEARTSRAQGGAASRAQGGAASRAQWGAVGGAQAADGNDYAIFETHDHRSNKIYNFELTMI